MKKQKESFESFGLNYCLSHRILVYTNLLSSISLTDYTETLFAPKSPVLQLHATNDSSLAPLCRFSSSHSNLPYLSNLPGLSHPENFQVSLRHYKYNLISVSNDGLFLMEKVINHTAYLKRLLSSALTCCCPDWLLISHGSFSGWLETFVFDSG